MNKFLSDWFLQLDTTCFFQTTHSYFLAKNCFPQMFLRKHLPSCAFLWQAKSCMSDSFEAKLPWCQIFVWMKLWVLANQQSEMEKQCLNRSKHYDSCVRFGTFHNAKLLQEYLQLRWAWTGEMAVCNGLCFIAIHLLRTTNVHELSEKMNCFVVHVIWDFWEQ